MGSAARLLVALTTGGVLALSAGAPAWGHADVRETTPTANSRVGKPPRVVKLVLAEPPGPGSALRVRDGCGGNVVEDVVASEVESTLSAALQRGEPGRWRVRFESVSATDGHLVRGGFKFRVAGKHRCENERKVARGQNRQGPPGVDLRDDEGGTSLPIVPLALGTVALVGIALVARRSTL
ncbi:MAG: copper resistance CopC family protein [Actinomycetota bacterium]